MFLPCVGMRLFNLIPPMLLEDCDGTSPLIDVVRVVSVFLMLPVFVGLCVVVIFVKANGGY